MMRKFPLLLLSILLLAGISSLAQERLTWKMLANIEYKEAVNEEYEMIYNKPYFSEEILALEGKEVMIIGYLLPIDVKSDYYILSANPFASCFFCGGGGPESVIELKLKKDYPNLKMDDLLMFKGILKLNDSDIHQMNYILEEAELVKR